MLRLLGCNHARVGLRLHGACRGWARRGRYAIRIGVGGCGGRCSVFGVGVWHLNITVFVICLLRIVWLIRTRVRRRCGRRVNGHYRSAGARLDGSSGIHLHGRHIGRLFLVIGLGGSLRGPRLDLGTRSRNAVRGSARLGSGAGRSHLRLGFLLIGLVPALLRWRGGSVAGCCRAVRDSFYLVRGKICVVGTVHSVGVLRDHAAAEQRQDTAGLLLFLVPGGRGTGLRTSRCICGACYVARVVARRGTITVPVDDAPLGLLGLTPDAISGLLRRRTT